MGIWDSDVRNQSLANNDSIQKISTIPENVRRRYRTVWEISQKAILELAIGRGPFVD